ncbi:hypothetical protein NECAME_11912 [Necator americanus]|uniref:Uncharacterized protein n=1 Tax=Necator americanus TaxID=51031 RepID=W2T3H1_NECAM|nr:hypothetical protein NECAME_11912 [Necator americanus]ETN76109.1 hypothetical protein NECAME_11912 [Necator americanus]
MTYVCPNIRYPPRKGEQRAEGRRVGCGFPPVGGGGYPVAPPPPPPSYAAPPPSYVAPPSYGGGAYVG